MHKAFNKNLHIHIKVRGKHHPINIGLVIVVVLASIITWFLTEYIVYELNTMDLAVIEWVSEVRPEVKAQASAPWNLHGDLRVRGHHLEYEDGTKFFWYGGMDWGLFTRLNLTEADLYLSTRASQGMTVIQANALGLNGHGLSAGTCPGVNEERNRNPFDIQPFVSTYDATSAKVPEYWSHVESIIDIASNYGLYIAFLPVWGTFTIDDWGDRKDPNKIFNTPSDAYNYGQWLGNRFRNKKNIIWMIGGDVSADYRSKRSGSIYTEPYDCVCDTCSAEDCHDWQCWCSDPNNCRSLDIWDNLARGVKAGDTGDHLMTGHFQHNIGTCRMLTKPSDWFSSASWLDFDTTYTSSFVEEFNEVYNTTPVRPSFVSEGTFLGYGTDDFRFRRMCYQTFLSGGRGYSIGEANVWMFYDETKVPKGIDLKPEEAWNFGSWKDRLNRLEMIWNNICIDYLKSIDWWKLVPDQQLILSGEISNDPELRRAAAYSSDNDLILVYFPDSSVNATINISGLNASNARVRWRNPVTGSEEALGDFTTSQNLQVNPPSTWNDSSTFEDGLLIIEPSTASSCTDNDSDGYGVCPNCGVANGCTYDGDDCDDSEKYAYPGNTNETCDTVDNNCNSQTDEGCDNDNDDYCDTSMKVYRNNSMCPNTLFIDGRDGNDCNDTNDAINPGKTEICGNGINEDCDDSNDICPATGLSLGQHTITLTATDQDGNIAEDTIQITVNAVEPSGTLFAPYLEWTLNNSSYSGNPFDLVASATFTHQGSGETRTTEMFYDRSNTWKFRFTATRTGTWTFTTQSSDSDLDGHSGTVTIDPNPNGSAHGFVKQLGNKWGWEGTGTAFTPQLVMLGGNVSIVPRDFYNNTTYVNGLVQEFIGDHGFDGFHVAVVAGYFFDIYKSDERVNTSLTEPDPRTFEALEDLITAAHAAGGLVHIWLWGDSSRSQTSRQLTGGINGSIDQRLQRYIAARLGPVPGWTIGYGYDLDEWVTANQLDTWHDYMQAQMGWHHFLAGRPAGPNTGINHSQFNTWNDGLDYSSYEHHQPSYDVYVAAMSVLTDQPVFSEDRFRIRDGGYPAKDYTEEMTRRGLYTSVMAGGCANIWGYLKNSTGIYPNKTEIKTYSVFFRDNDRFKADMVRDNSRTDGYCLRSSATDSLVFYKENASSIQLDLTGIGGSRTAVAVDTKQAYSEIAIGSLAAADQTWTAPYVSDWAIAVGSFEQPPAASVGLYDTYEISIKNTKSYSNNFNYNDIELSAVFTSLFPPDDTVNDN